MIESTKAPEGLSRNQSGIFSHETSYESDIKAGDAMKARVAVFGVLRFPPENINDVLPHLHELIRSTYENDGCIAYDVAEDPFDKGLLRFSELWPDRESLERHLKAPHIEPWRIQAKKYGLSEREFVSYDLLVDAVPV